MRVKHQLEYSIWSCRVSWCPICKEHFYNDSNKTHTTRQTEDHYHILEIKPPQKQEKHMEITEKAQEEAALEGFFYAVGLFNKLHNKPDMCAGVIKEAYLGTVNCKDFDEFEKEQLRIINKEPGMGLLGL